MASEIYMPLKPTLGYIDASEKKLTKMPPKAMESQENSNFLSGSYFIIIYIVI